MKIISINRYLTDFISEDALRQGKMAFLNGPRQVGKSTIAKSLLAKYNSTQYFNWDDEDFQKTWIKSPKSVLSNIAVNDLVVFDEIHKDVRWKTKLKGLYDLYQNQFKFLVTGSARLNYYRKSGDSLQGRYLPYRLHPFTFGENNFIKEPPRNFEMYNNDNHNFNIQDLLTLGGFPEPYLNQSDAKAKRWRRLYRERLIREDLRDLQNVMLLKQMESLALILEGTVGSGLSHQSLARDLHISFDTIARWIELLEATYYCYRIKPYCKNLKNSLVKEPKLYLYDWSRISNPAARLENFVASHLLKSCHAWTDCAFGEFELHYLKTKQKQEVDFLVTENGKPYLMVEVKTKSTNLNPAIFYFKDKLKPQFCIQVVKDSSEKKYLYQSFSGILILTLEEFLSALN